jgi:hypothetical protein
VRILTHGHSAHIGHAVLTHPMPLPPGGNIRPPHPARQPWVMLCTDTPEGVSGPIDRTSMPTENEPTIRASVSGWTYTGAAWA